MGGSLADPGFWWTAFSAAATSAVWLAVFGVWPARFLRWTWRVLAVVSLVEVAHTTLVLGGDLSSGSAFNSAAGTASGFSVGLRAGMAVSLNVLALVLALRVSNHYRRPVLASARFSSFAPLTLELPSGRRHHLAMSLPDSFEAQAAELQGLAAFPFVVSQPRNFVDRLWFIDRPLTQALARPAKQPLPLADIGGLALAVIGSAFAVATLTSAFSVAAFWLALLVVAAVVAVAVISFRRFEPGFDVRLEDFSDPALLFIQRLT